MKKIVAFMFCCASYLINTMEISTPVVCSPGRAHNGDFALVPHEIIEKKIMPYFATLKRSPLLHAQTFHAFCKSNKYFSRFLKDLKINELIIKSMTSYNNEKKEWAPIIEKKLIFSAAFQLHTEGARVYLKTFGRPNSWDHALPVLSTVIPYPNSDRICRFALLSGIDPNYVWWGQSALQQAVATNRRKCVHELLIHGADPNFFNNSHMPWSSDIPPRVPLGLALMYNCTSRIISNLLLHGADPTKKDLSGQSPLEFARKKRVDKKTLQLLEKYARRFNTVGK